MSLSIKSKLKCISYYTFLCIPYTDLAGRVIFNILDMFIFRYKFQRAGFSKTVSICPWDGPYICGQQVYRLNRFKPDPYKLTYCYIYNLKSCKLRVPVIK